MTTINKMVSMRKAYPIARETKRVNHRPVEFPKAPRWA
jgi:hypothetical protein